MTVTKIPRREVLRWCLSTGALAGVGDLSGLVSCAFAGESSAARIEILKRRVIGMPPHEICFERARLMTTSYRRSEGEATVIRRAKAFYAIADGIPIRIDEGELVVGNLSRGPRVAYFAPESYQWRRYQPGKEQVLQDARFSRDLAIRFRIPDEIADYWRERPQGDTAGHFVADYQRVLRKGFTGIRQEIDECREDLRRRGVLDQSSIAFYEAAQIACDAAERFAARYAEDARRLAGETDNPARRQEFERIADICTRVPAQPARSFAEALQAFWFTHLLLHLNSSEWSISPGRFDQYMGPFYQQDIAQGKLMRDEAAELLACLWIKFNEIRLASVDFVNYQNLIVGGPNEQGEDATNDLSLACLETTLRLKDLVQPSLSLRWHPSTPPALLEKACELILTGCGRPAVFNDLAIVPALKRAGVRDEDAQDYAIAGCEEPTVPGKLFGAVRGGQVNQAQCLLTALAALPDRAGFDDLLAAYRRELSREHQRAMLQSRQRDEANAQHTPHPFVSLLFDGCLAQGKDITEGGARYNMTSISEAGTMTAADSLLALKKAVWEEKVATLPQLKEALRADFHGFDKLRAHLTDRVPKFGNDIDEIDELACRLAAMNCEVLDELDEHDFRDGRFVTGSGNSTAYRAGLGTGATPDGRCRGEALSVSLGPTAGADRKGPTAMLNSVAKLNWHQQPGGALTHVKLPYTGAQRPTSKALLGALVRAFFAGGGLGLHFSVVDAQALRDALKEPEKHLDLLVRVGGFSAPFVLLSPEIQKNIIERTEHEL